MTSSWITSGLGYAVIVLTWFNQAFVEQSVPQNGKEWLAFLTMNIGGLIGVFAKDFNKSNSAHPQADAVVVPPKV